MDRKAFIQSLIGTGAVLAFPGASRGSISDGIQRAFDDLTLPVDGAMVGYADTPIEQVRVGIIGLGNRGNTLLEMLQYNVEQGDCVIVALGDLVEEKATKAAAKLAQFQAVVPKVYTGSETKWKKLVKRNDVDLVLVCTPWEWHAPMCRYSMEQGKHVASEVPISVTLTEAWQLVKTAEETRRHCIMIENCCYNDEELFVLNMIENGVFGDLTHCEGAYLHDLRKHMLDQGYYQDQWRIKHHMKRDGNFYTTHGLGPISFYLKIGRGDTYSHLTSMSSRELNLSETAKAVGSPYSEIKCGDMNTTMIRTANGKTIMLQFDVHTGRPYSRINKVVGTKATHDGYPSRLYIDKEPVWWGHNWLSEEEYARYKKEYQHPMVRKLKAISEGFKQGHGGMDFVMMYRLIKCLNYGLPLDINVYDSVMWSAVSELSEISVASSSSNVEFPDFTGGTWKEERGLEVMRELEIVRK